MGTVTKPMSDSSAADSFDGDPVEEWFFPKLARADLRALSRRTNRHGLAHVGIWLLLCLCSGAAVVGTWGAGWSIPAMAVYGVFLSFSYAASHECSHGTAFRTRWLNEGVFWVTSVIFMEEAVYRRYAHADHHTYTWFNGADPQKPYGIPLSAWVYIKETFLVTFYPHALLRLLRHSLGRFDEREQRFLPSREQRRVQLDSILMLGIYLGLLAWGILLQSPWPFALYFIPRYIGGCVVNLYINSQHMCMAEDLKDHRLTTRSIRCNRIERILYWNMNFHIEHHLYPAVPFHALAKLNARVSSELPVPTAGVWSANREIIRAIRRQRREPGFHLS
jgi:fatty acid desaturase